MIQVRGDIEDNSEITFLISQQKHTFIDFVTPHLNGSKDGSQNMFFYGEIWLKFPKLSLLPLLIWSTVEYGMLPVSLQSLPPQSGTKDSGRGLKLLSPLARC